MEANKAKYLKLKRKGLHISDVPPIYRQHTASGKTCLFLQQPKQPKPARAVSKKSPIKLMSGERVEEGKNRNMRSPRQSILGRHFYVALAAAHFKGHHFCAPGQQDIR